MIRKLEAPSDLTALRYRAQQRAAWEFAAAIEDWRCSVCLARISYEERARYERTHLCGTCSHAVNESPIWQSAGI